MFFVFVSFCLLTGTIFAVNIKGGSPLSIKIDGKDTTLTLVDVTVGANNEILNIEGFQEEFTLNPTWTVFGLKEGKEYNLTTWDIAGSCGCTNQICGQDCPGVKGEDCDSNIIDPPFTCVLSARRGFCWGFVETGTTQNYTLYNLSHVGTLALTSYGGPAESFFVAPGFTVRSQHHQERYSLNALITGFTPRKQIALSNYFYAESEGRVISIEEFALFKSKPNLNSINVKIGASTCPKDGYPMFQSTKRIQTLDVDDKASFRSYMILRKGKTENLSSLFQRYILTPNGLLEWNKEKTFDIFDPCNQQFLTLQQDEMGNFFVILPMTQSLMSENIICVAISDVNTNMFDLVLYELNNATSIWKASDRFRGLLSSDYVDSLQLRVTTKSSLPIRIPQARVEVGYNIETNPPILKITTSIPLSCEIFLSPNCIFNLTTSKEHLFMTTTIDSCGYWYEIGRYMCEGVAGNFHSPEKFVQAPISAFTENTTDIQAFSFETISAVNIPIDQAWYTIWWKGLTLFERCWWCMILVILVYMIIYIIRVSHKTHQAELHKNEETDELVELQQEQNTMEPNFEYFQDESQFYPEEYSEEDQFEMDPSQEENEDYEVDFEDGPDERHLYRKKETIDIYDLSPYEVKLEVQRIMALQKQQ